MRRIGVLMSMVESDPRGLEYITAFAQGSAELGWNTAGAQAISIAFADTLRNWSRSRRMSCRPPAAWPWRRCCSPPARRVYDCPRPVGGKGIGEPSLVGAAPAIANAISNATGARVRALPMTPERVLDALEARS
jgi:hypothetical protein